MAKNDNDKPPTVEEINKRKKEVDKHFNSGNLMFDIIDEISKKHKDDEKGKGLVFLAECSSQLLPVDRFSVAVRGGSAEGKSDLVKSCSEHIPDEYYSFGTRFTRSTLEDDIREKDLLIVLEKPSDIEVLETLKQIAEDGLKPWKKEKSSSGQFILKNNDFIDRKAVMYTSTEAETNEELSNRFLVYNIKSNPERYKRVIDHITDVETHPDKKIESESKYKKNSWLKEGIRCLERFDIISIPYIKLIPFNTSSARLQRDVKRFINIIKTIAWINQRNRFKFEYKDKKILVASIEDFWWADYLSKDAFIESISGLSPQLEEVLKELDDLSKNPDNLENLSTYNGELRDFIDRAKIQKKMNISLNTIKSYCDALINQGIIETYSPNAHSRVYLKRIYKGVKHPLHEGSIGCQYKALKKIEKILYKKYFDNLSQPLDTPFDTLFDTLNTTNIGTIICIIGTSGNIEGINDFQKSIGDMDFNAYINVLISMFSEQLTPTSFFNSKNEQDTLGNTIKKVNVQQEEIGIQNISGIPEIPFSDRIGELRVFCDGMEIKGKVNSYENLIYNFDKSFIEKCKQEKLLIPNGKGYVFNGVDDLMNVDVRFCSIYCKVCKRNSNFVRYSLLLWTCKRCGTKRHLSKHHYLLEGE